jgi:membrane fusion protein (multidrug efflux system)
VLNCLPAEIGEFVSPGMCVAQIVDVDQVKIVVDVPERDIGYLTLGAEQTVLHGIDHPREAKGKITYISELADTNTRTTRVEITADNPSGSDGRRTLRSGQIVQAQIIRQKLHDITLVPLEAVIPLEKGYIAYVVENGLAERRSVELDPSLIKGQSIRVLAGLKTGDRLIVSRDNRICPDQPVRVISTDDRAVSASQPTSSETRP